MGRLRRKGTAGHPWAAVVEAFAKHQVDYVIIGKSGAILHGFSDTTQDIDIFPRKSPENGRRIVAALREVGFQIDLTLEKAIVSGKDFVQMRGGPVDLNLVFAPHGLESFEATRERAALLEGIYPVASLVDIIHSKKKAARQKDNDVLRRLEGFARFLRHRR
jgi:hypothetical protein